MFDIPNYLAQDFLLNGNDHFKITLHSSIIPKDSVGDLNASMTYETFREGVLATAKVHLNDVVHPILIYIKCKIGSVSTYFPYIEFIDGSCIQLAWAGAKRVFLRIRYVESALIDDVKTMLLDDLSNRYSVSDVENSDYDQSFRPWSDEDNSEHCTDENDSEHDTIDDHLSGEDSEI